MTKEIVPAKSKEVQIKSPVEIMEFALSKNMDVDKLEKILEIQERYDANEAKKAYTKAMAEFKKNPPKILKDMSVSYKQTNYNHASLGNVTETINKSLANYGFSSSWKTNQENLISVTCTITHKLGHSESTSLAAGSDTTGSKNLIQAIGSTITYLERYTLLALTGLATHEDDDGSSFNLEFITPDQVKKITDGIKEKGIDVDEVLKFADAETIDTITNDTYNRVMSTIKATKCV